MYFGFCHVVRATSWKGLRHVSQEYFPSPTMPYWHQWQTVTNSLLVSSSNCPSLCSSNEKSLLILGSNVEYSSILSKKVLLKSTKMSSSLPFSGSSRKWGMVGWLGWPWVLFCWIVRASAWLLYWVCLIIPIICCILSKTYWFCLLNYRFCLINNSMIPYVLFPFCANGVPINSPVTMNAWDLHDLASFPTAGQDHALIPL